MEFLAYANQVRRALKSISMTLYIITQLQVTALHFRDKLPRNDGQIPAKMTL